MHAEENVREIVASPPEKETALPSSDRFHFNSSDFFGQHSLSASREKCAEKHCIAV